MILYNVTVGIDRSVEEEWLQWMRLEHIPRVLDTGMFESYKMFRVLSHEETDTVSYSIQYFSESMTKVELYLTKFAPALVEEHRMRYKDKHVAFRTLLEEI